VAASGPLCSHAAATAIFRYRRSGAIVTKAACNAAPLVFATRRKTWISSRSLIERSS
jgi:hypothetical protein